MSFQWSVSFWLFLFFPLTVWSSPLLRCQDVFSKNLFSLNIEWTPYSQKSLETPEVLSDPYVQWALRNESFRTYLLQMKESGQSLLNDFKQLADAEPLYTKEMGPQLPLMGNRVLMPQELKLQEIYNYITRNYKIRPDTVQDKVEFEASERRPLHPLDNNLTSTPRVQQALDHIHKTWERLLRKTPEGQRSSLLFLPKKYVVAGGRFRESYFWDSYWIMKGLIESGYKKTALGMLENFVYSMEVYGIIPNGNRFYYLTRTQVPLFMEMVKLLQKNQMLDFAKSNIEGSLEARVLKVAQDYYEKIWRETDRKDSETGLFKYSDGAGGAKNSERLVIRPETGLNEPRSKEKHSQRVYAESGWDMSYSRFGKTPQNWAPVELNFILHSYLKDLSQLMTSTGHLQKAQQLSLEAQTLKEKMDQYLFDKETGLYLDYNLQSKSLSSTITAASFFPFYFGAYSNTSATKAVLASLLGTLKPPGHLAVHTTNKKGEGQWDGAWSWAPLNEIAFQALLRYGLNKEAEQLAYDYAYMTILSYYKNQFAFYEKYQAADGSIRLPKETEIYGNEEGFGWTNATVSVFIRSLYNSGRIEALEKDLEGQF